jgi:hypothetical protein
MGAWGHAAFDNDTALDWISVFEDEGSSAIADAITYVATAQPPSDVEAPEAEEALAAIAILRGKLLEDLSEVPEAAREAAQTHWDAIEVSDDLKGHAAAAIDVILDDGCELQQLWAETDDFEDWRQRVLHLRSAF